ncbi:ABC transporter permease [Otariodibacter sp.]|uniref:ABC transporter permease n=1 Tax=Otariodibacter sp. TaxID=3030919 RepID=UPI00261B996A|nr:ABC transporter permease [Otariodibacter sp.]
MKNWFKNVFYLSIKELRSLFSDPILLVLIAYMFSMAVIMIANMPTTEVRNAAVAIVDNDHSTLSYKLRDSLILPNFKTVTEVSIDEVDHLMDTGEYTFVIDIPPNYEQSLLKEENPKIQLLVDATAVSQANIGSIYIKQIFTQEINKFLKKENITNLLPIDITVSVLYNPNHSSVWIMGTMQIIGGLNLLVLLLVGAAVIRERERGTIEHLLVMPVSASEIAASKILANGFILVVVSILSLFFIVKGVLNVPIPLSAFPLFALGVITYVFAISSLGILLATIAPSMPQFGLLCIPVYIMMYLLSGAISPLENMPQLAQMVTQFSPTTILGAYAQDVLFRGASLNLVWQELIKIIAIGLVFLGISLTKFKSMLSKQG